MTQEEREARALTAIIDSFDRHIWEGWTVWDFIEALRPELDLIMTGRSIYKPFTSKKALRACSVSYPKVDRNRCRGRRGQRKSQIENLKLLDFFMNNDE